MCAHFKILFVALSITFSWQYCNAEDIAKQQLFATIHIFHKEADKFDGSYPNRLIIGGDGNLYGSTRRGGKFNGGTIFKISPKGEYLVVHQFSGPDGLTPFGCLLLTDDGTLYGTTNQYGPRTMVYGISNGGEFKVVYVFPDNSNEGLSVHLNGIDGNIYTISDSRHSYGFELTKVEPHDTDEANNEIKSHVAGSNHPQPRTNTRNSVSLCSDAAINASGKAFATEANGGTVTTPKITIPLSDPNSKYVRGAFGAPAIDSRGDIYAITSWDGSNHFGIVKISNDGSISLAYVLNSLPNAVGTVRPKFGLVATRDNYFYGIVEGDYDAIYRFKPDSNIEIAYLPPKGKSPIRFSGPLIEMPDQSIVGFYSEYYDVHDGAVFKLKLTDH